MVMAREEWKILRPCAPLLHPRTRLVGEGLVACDSSHGEEPQEKKQGLFGGAPYEEGGSQRRTRGVSSRRPDLESAA